MVKKGQKTAKKLAKASDIPVVILCGGKGTRLHEETMHVPKPLVVIGDKPILWHIMKCFHEQGYRRFILLLGYKGEKIKEYFLHYAQYSRDFVVKQTSKGQTVTYLSKPTEDWEVTLLDTGAETQTGGRIKQLETVLKKEKRFLLTYGDGVSDVTLLDTLNSHLASKKVVTMTGVQPAARFGEIKAGERGGWRFLEKPTVSDKRINGGFFVVETSLLQQLPLHRSLNFEVEVLPKLAEADQLNISTHDGYWRCMDTLHDAEALRSEWASGNAPWKIWK